MSGDKFKIDLNTLQDFITEVSTYTNKLDEWIKRVETEHSTLHKTWTGEAATSHKNYHDKWMSESKRMHELVKQLHVLTKASHVFYDNAAKTNNDMWPD